MPITLFPDQQEALDRALDVYRDCPVGGKALVVAPTAWGKTIFFNSFIQAVQETLQGEPVLIIAHRDELLDRAREKMWMIDPTAIVGKVGGGVYEYGAPITVAGIDTISKENHLKNLPKFGYGLIIVDECHHSPAPKYQKVFQVLDSAFKLGVTATPDRLDGKALDPIFGPPIFHMSIVDAIAKKRLSDVKAIAIRTEVNLDDIHSKKNAEGDMDFNQQELDLAVNTPARNRRIVEAYQEHANGKRAICFAVTVAHAESLASTFNAYGIPAACIQGDTPLPERKRIYAAFDHGDIKVLTNVLVLTEGFDAPKIECVIMARPTQSRALYIQCLGRGLRRAPGKQLAIVLDLTDNCMKHRLEPQNLHKVIGKQLHDKETVTSALAREEREAEEKETQVHKLRAKRVADIQIDLLETFEWQERSDGLYVLEVGMEKHRIALVPSQTVEGYYYVAARLAPTFEAQKWSSNHPLDWCQSIAEKKARTILSEGIGLVDKTRWGNDPATENQIKMLTWYKIPTHEGMTKGEASELIDAHKEAIEQKKRAKAARKAEKEHVSI